MVDRRRESPVTGVSLFPQHSGEPTLFIMSLWKVRTQPVSKLLFWALTPSRVWVWAVPGALGQKESSRHRVWELRGTGEATAAPRTSSS